MRFGADWKGVSIEKIRTNGELRQRRNAWFSGKSVPRLMFCKTLAALRPPQRAGGLSRDPPNVEAKANRGDTGRVTSTARHRTLL